MSISKEPRMFSGFPAELRLKIWRYFHRNIGPRVVTLCYNQKIGYFSKTTPPATLFINKESRIEAQKLFTAAFTSHYPFDTEFQLGFFNYTPIHNLAPIYVDFSKDIICLQESQGEDITIALEAMSSEDRLSIQQMAINVDDLYPTRPSMRPRRAAIASMSQLHCLFTVRLDAWLIWSVITEQEMEQVLFRGYGIRGLWQASGRTGSGRNWGVPKEVHICRYELVTMNGVHKERANRPELAMEYRSGRRHLFGQAQD